MFAFCAGIPVPLDHMLQGVPELKLPGSSSSGGRHKAGKEGKEKKAKEGPVASSDAKPSAARRRSTSKSSIGSKESPKSAEEVAKKGAAVVQQQEPPSLWSLALSLLMVLVGMGFAWYLSPAQ